MTIYPGSIDTNTSLPLVIDDVTPVNAITVNRLRETLIAVETELGTDPSGGYSTVASRLTALEASGGAAHATTHEDGGSDELTIQNLGSGAAAANKVVVTDGAGGLTLQDYSSGVSGSGTDNHLVRWDGTDALQDSSIVVLDTGETVFSDLLKIDQYGDLYWTHSGTSSGATHWISAGDATVPGYDGDNFRFEAGYGLEGTAQPDGGEFTLKSGGGAIRTDPGALYSGLGGDFNINAGKGGNSNTSGGSPGHGGWIDIIAGASGNIQAGGTGTYGSGGRVTINGGTGAYSFEPSEPGTVGGTVYVTGGTGGYGGTSTSGGGRGGHTFAQGGPGGQVSGAGTPGDGGNLYLQGGRSYGATHGSIIMGHLYTSAIEIAASGITTTVFGPLHVDSATAADNYFDLDNGAGAALSAAGHVRIRSNAGALEASQNGGAWAPVGGGPWTDTGTVVYVTTTTRNVAIGANSMVGSEKLRVSGDSYHEGNIEFADGAGGATRYLRIVNNIADNPGGFLNIYAASGTDGFLNNGGTLNLVAGKGGNDSSWDGANGGNTNVYAGNGGDTTHATRPGGPGGSVNIVAANGGDASGTGAGGDGGSAYVYGGTGKDPTGGGTRGDGGNVSMTGGSGLAGGNAYVYGGTAYDTGNGGNAVVQGGNAAGTGVDGVVNIGIANTSAVSIGAVGIVTTVYGPLAIDDASSSTGISFAPSEYSVGRTRYIRCDPPTTAGYEGDSITISAAAGLDGGTGGRDGGNASLIAGAGAVNTNASQLSGQGGQVTIRTGEGGWGNASGGSPYRGGQLWLGTGAGGRFVSGSGSTGSFPGWGGQILILPGDGGLSLEPTIPAGPGGQLQMEGGEGGLGYNSTGDGGPGGQVDIRGGRAGRALGSGNDGDAGSVLIDAGNPYSGTPGTVDLGVTAGPNYYASAIRCYAPTTIYNSLFIDSATASENFFDLEDGTGAAVSAAGAVRIRNNAGKLEVSEDGYAYAPLGYVDTGAAKTGAYNAVIGDLVKVDPSGGGFAVTLPTAVGYANQGITVKNVTNSTNAVTFNTTGGQTIDGMASGVDQIDTAYETVTFISDGSNWMRFPAA